ncbi:unnamed protein product [Haemonchus placei]|uniref:Uncharacterized protein n=1 Tax=Haemonchus placei TaxID=6290 RepID=A0A0N4X575_HAEPC|nr:unnamed protein product [Haemonchus placei]
MLPLSVFRLGLVTTSEVSSTATADLGPVILIIRR